MYSFTVDARNGMAGGDCAACCCEPLTARAGEANKVQINYAPWSAPIGGRGLSPHTSFEIGECATCTGPSPVESAFSRVLVNEALSGDLAPLYPDPSPGPVSWAILGLYGPLHGEVELLPSGEFTYMPHTGFYGVDRFWFSANGIVAEYIVSVDRVGNPNAQPAFTPVISIPSNRVEVKTREHAISFALSVSPAAVTGDVYRLQVLQPALDCDCQKYQHVSCYDVIIGKCG